MRCRRTRSEPGAPADRVAAGIGLDRAASTCITTRMGSLRALLLSALVACTAAGITACRFDTSGLPALDARPDAPALDLAVDAPAADLPLLPDGPLQAPDLPPGPCAQWALRFDGAAWAEVASTAGELRFTDDFTVMAWIRPSRLAASARYHVVSRHADPLAGYALVVDRQRPELWVFFGPAVKPCRCGDPATRLTQVDRWSHLAGSFSAGTARLFVDGRVKATCSCAGTTAGSYYGVLRIGGASVGAAASRFHGVIDDVWLLSAARTSAFGPASLGSSCTDVAARYTFSAGVGQVLASDCSGPLAYRGSTAWPETTDPAWVAAACVNDR